MTSAGSQGRASGHRSQETACAVEKKRRAHRRGGPRAGGSGGNTGRANRWTEWAVKEGGLMGGGWHRANDHAETGPRRDR